MRKFAIVSVLVAAVFAAVTGTASAATFAAAAPPPRPAPGGVGVRLVDIPTAAADDPRARQYIVDRLAPGAVIHRRIEVSNATQAPAHIAIYPAAATIENGSFLGAAGHTANDLSSWTTLDPGALDLAPGAGAKALDTVTVTVPADAAPGEQYAAVWAEITSPTASGVTLVNRVAIRMYVSVGAGNAPASSFTIDSLTAARAPDGHPMVTAQVHNTGGRALDMSGTLSLTDGPGSLTAGPFPAQLGSTLAPGQSTPVTISLNQQLPNGPWHAALTLKSGLLQQNTQARIQFPAGPGTTAPVTAQNPLGDYLPVLIGALIVLALAIAATLVLVRRRRAHRHDAQHPT